MTAILLVLLSVLVGCSNESRVNALHTSLADYVAARQQDAAALSVASSGKMDFEEFERIIIATGARPLEDRAFLDLLLEIDAMPNPPPRSGELGFSASELSQIGYALVTILMRTDVEHEELLAHAERLRFVTGAYLSLLESGRVHPASAWVAASLHGNQIRIRNLIEGQTAEVCNEWNQFREFCEETETRMVKAGAGEIQRFGFRAILETQRKADGEFSACP